MSSRKEACPVSLLNNECAGHAGMSPYLARKQIGSRRNSESKVQTTARCDAQTAGRCRFTGNGGGFNEDRRIGQEAALKFMKFPSFIEQGEMNGPRACQVNRIGTESKVLCDDVHRLALTIAAEVPGAKEEPTKG